MCHVKGTTTCALGEVKTFPHETAKLISHACYKSFLGGDWAEKKSLQAAMIDLYSFRAVLSKRGVADSDSSVLGL